MNKLMLLIAILCAIAYGTDTKYIFGNSIVNAGGATDTLHGFKYLLGQAHNWSFVTKSTNGAQIQDICQTHVSAATFGATDTSVYLAGYNDMRDWGTAATGYNTFKYGFCDAIVTMAIVSDSLVTAKDASVTTVGDWTNIIAGVLGGKGKFSAANNDSMTFTVSGTAVYLDAIALDATFGNTGKFTVAIDGVSKGEYNCYGAATPYSEGSNWVPVFLRFGGLTNAEHTVVIAHSAGSGGVNIVYINWCFGTSSISSPKPAVYVGGCLKMSETGYTTGIGARFVSGSDAEAAQYNTFMDSVITIFRSDGLNIWFVDPNDFYSTSTHVADDYIHPNDAGHVAIKDAFESIINPEDSDNRGDSYNKPSYYKKPYVNDAYKNRVYY